jgi:hypothetical protein
MQELGDAPIEERYRESMVRLARLLDEYFNEDKVGQDRPVGFVLLVFPYGDRSGRCNYISNGADRRDMITLFKEQIARFEGRPDIEGNA